MNDFVEEMAELTGKKVEDLTIEFSNFMEIVDRQYSGRLDGDELTERAESLFKQKCRAEIKSDEASGSVSVTMYVTGISDTQDKIQWLRSKHIDIYKLNPNKAILAGKVNEYRITENGVMKRSFDQAEQKVIETMVDSASPDSEEVDDFILVAPRDNQTKGFGGKQNTNFGQELPLHKYSCYVHGFAEVDGSDDIRWTKFMLRGDNSLNHKLEINKIYSFKVINMTHKDSQEYNFIDTGKPLSFDEVNWELFDLEITIKQNFIENRIIELGGIEHYLKNVEQLKDSKKFTDWNAAILVEADVSSIYPGKNGVSDRLYVDDDSLRWETDDMQSNINAWLSKHNVIDFGEYSRILMTCYPSRSKPLKDSPDGTIGSAQLNVYGLYAFAKYKTVYEPKE